MLKQALRDKFVEGAKKYLGTPYAKRFLKDGDEHFAAPLFLNCSGLITKTVEDLQEDFGFKLCKWSPAYLFDTLPIDVKEEDMKVGDLIFY